MKHIQMDDENEDWLKKSAWAEKTKKEKEKETREFTARKVARRFLIGFQRSV